MCSRNHHRHSSSTQIQSPGHAIVLGLRQTATSDKANFMEGKHNLAYYPTKHYSIKHHIEVRPTYVLNNVKIQMQNALKTESKQQYCKGVFKPIQPNNNGQSKPGPRR